MNTSHREAVSTKHLSFNDRRLIRLMVDDTFDAAYASASDGTLVLSLALDIEGDHSLVMDWYQATPIAELNSLTAEQMVTRGAGESVIAFLRSILRGDRDARASGGRCL